MLAASVVLDLWIWLEKRREPPQQQNGAVAKQEPETQAPKHSLPESASGSYSCVLTRC